MPVLKITKIVFVMIICMLLLICSKNESTEPDPEVETTELEELFSEIIGVSHDGELDVVIVDTSSVEFDLGSGTGDSVEVSLGDESVYIIAGSDLVSEDTDFSIDCQLLNFDQGNDTALVAMYFNCLPDGLEFDNSLIIDVGSEGFNNHPNSNVVKLYQYNENNNRWSNIDTQQKSDPRLRFEIDHFSRYAISD
ncbi:MAG: hypothetical protein GY839_01570 [candidate division Zixibacteria bacterium]|nr:hypothetical protein [candidate division Zixibacteria bacterium]